MGAVQTSYGKNSKLFIILTICHIVTISLNSYFSRNEMNQKYNMYKKYYKILKKAFRIQFNLVYLVLEYQFKLSNIINTKY